MKMFNQVCGGGYSIFNIKECMEMQFGYYFVLSLLFLGWVEDVIKGKLIEMGKVLYFYYWVYFI